MQHVTDMKPCEEEAGKSTVEAVNAMRARGATVVGLTARHPTLRVHTHGMLTKNGIKLGDSGGGSSTGATDTISYSLGDPSPPGSVTADMACPLVFHGGVVYCCGPRKAEGAHALLQSLPAARRRSALLVDDRLQHIQTVAESFLATAIWRGSGNRHIQPASPDGGAPLEVAQSAAESVAETAFRGFHFTRMAAVANQALELDPCSQLLTRALCSAHARPGFGHAAEAAAGGATAPELGGSMGGGALDLSMLPSSM